MNGEGCLQRSSMPKIYENPAEFGPRNFVFIHFQVEIRASGVATLRNFLYKDSRDRMQRSTLPEIDRNEARFGPRA